MVHAFREIEVCGYIKHIYFNKIHVGDKWLI